MKRFIALIVFSVFMVLPLFSQVDPDPPTDIISWIGLLPIYLGSVAGVALSVPLWAAIIIGFFNEPTKVVKYIITGIIAMILVLAAYFLDFGYLHGAKLWWIFPNWAGIVVVSILGYAVPLIKTILDAIAAKFNPWKPSR